RRVQRPAAGRDPTGSRPGRGILRPLRCGGGVSRDGLARGARAPAVRRLPALPRRRDARLHARRVRPVARQPGAQVRAGRRRVRGALSRRGRLPRRHGPRAPVRERRRGPRAHLRRDAARRRERHLPAVFRPRPGDLPGERHGARPSRPRRGARRAHRYRAAALRAYLERAAADLQRARAHPARRRTAAAREPARHRVVRGRLAAVLRRSLRLRPRRPLPGARARSRRPRAVARVVVRPAALPVGQGRLEEQPLAGGAAARATPFLVSFSDQLAITNFEQMVSLLRYFQRQDWVERLRQAPLEQRPAVWREFYTATDPDPSTPQNEALEEYFRRVQIADQRFREGSDPGWLTDRGEVFITLGEPDDIYDFSTDVSRSGPRGIRWTYAALRLTLFFQDQTGFGRFRLTPLSRAEFQRVVARLRQGR